MDFFLNHLWQSTVFAACAACGCYALRSNHARTRYWLWLAASLKFLIPFSILVSLGNRVEMPSGSPSVAAITVERISSTFAPAPMLAGPDRGTPGGPRWPLALGTVWGFGVLLVSGNWLRQGNRLRAIRRAAMRLSFDAPVPVFATRAPIEPAAYGIFRPVLLLPQGLADALTAEQRRAILMHELCHIRHRDNLSAALHMVVEALFWFHPLVWWIGARLIEERERACDEAVIAEGSRADVYAESIVSVCRFCLESPLTCTAGISGSDLKTRIREILNNRLSYRLTFARKILLAASGCAAIGIPTLIGILRAQTLPPSPQHTYEVVSIRPAKPGEVNSRIGPGPNGGLRAENITAMRLLTFAYNVQDYQFADAPGWVTSARFDVRFTPDKPEITPAPGMAREQMEGLFNRQRQRMQAVLLDRFGLVLRAETKDLPIYALTIAKGGHKLKTAENPKLGPNLRTGRKEMTGSGLYLNGLAVALSGLLGRPVRNETGLDGPYDIHLEWTPDSAADTNDSGGVSLFTALTEQLGLKLESKRGPVPVYVVEKIEKPTEN
jgi:uncharacterized protein (TIGR03435 family)